MLHERTSVRAILLTPARDVLLMRIRPPDGGAAFWITPGGGKEPGETTEACLRRELREELGLSEYEIGPVVWRRHHTFDWGPRRISQREEYRIVEVERFEPIMSDPIEATTLDRFRWWKHADLALATERLTPISLADIVSRFLRDGPPTEPLEVEVVI